MAINLQPASSAVDASIRMHQAAEHSLECADNTYETYATTPSSLSKYGKTQNVTDDVLTSSRVEVALGR